MKLEDIKIKDMNLMQSVSERADSSEIEIAIIGMALKMPQANTTAEFWNNLLSGNSNIRPLPVNRQIDTEKFFSITSNKTMEKNEGGYLEHIDYFDYEFFGISPNEAKVMDPNQRLFLEVVWHALEDAGYINKIEGSKTGIYVGFGDDAEYLNMIEKINANMKDIAIIGNTKSLISGRISHMLDLRGPSMNIDTACSSSLVALHLACQGIKNGDCDMAIAGGIRLFVNPGKENLNLGIESNKGIVCPFDEEADGTMWGEGVAALLLKPLTKAENAGDHIYAVIKGSAINQDGSSIGIIAPDEKAQEEVIKNAWKNARISPETISYIESHGTGTKIGDPIEAKAINDAFSEYTTQKEFCHLGTLKANIGHLVEASGIASIIKVILAMQKNILPQNLKLAQVNNQIGNGAIYFLKKNRTWMNDNIPKRGGISSFGFNGTNCHVVLEEFHQIEKEMAGEETQIFTLSAKTEKALQNLVDEYIEFIKTTKFDIRNICYTANIGRKTFDYRIGFTVSTKYELIKKLEKLKSNGYIFTVADEESSVISKFVSGQYIDWEYIYQGQQCKKIPLPLYPFANTRCWLTDLIGDNKTTPYMLQGRKRNDYTDTEKVIADVVYNVLGIEAIDIYNSISKYGVDSIVLVKIYNELKQHFPAIEISEVLSFSDIYSLGSFIDSKNKKQRDSNIKGENRKEKGSDIAVIGMALKLPNIENLEDFWKLIIEQKNTVGRFPDYREKQIKTYLNQLSENYKEITFEKGSYLPEIDNFDYEFFNISQKDAELMDPGQRLFLETVILALEDAGYSLEMVKGKNVAVYTGSSAGTLFNYGKMIYDLEPESLSMAITSNHPSILPGRVSYYLDLKGPSINIDTACSSSLVALALACNELRNENCDMAIVGGVHYDLAPIDIPGRKIGAESKQGIVRAFDDQSDGMLWGEGTGAVILKPLQKAISDKDGIYAIIEGIATNQDGKSMGIAAPNSLSQTEVIEKAWSDAKIIPDVIDYIETHGTGTYLGDPVEIEGIQRAFSKYTDKKQFCGISSVKPNIGHLETAAGILSFIKAVLSLHNKILPPIANLDFPNRKVDFVNSAMFLIDTPMKWNNVGSPRHCGISAFGFSGTNCHIVLREYEHSEKENLINIASIFLLTISAREQIALEKSINRYIVYLDQAAEEEIEALCYTANISNNNYQHKIAVIGKSKKDLIDKLQISLKSNSIMEDVFSNQIEYDYEHITDKYKKTCMDFIQGKTVDWENFYENVNVQKVHINISPFKNTKCWLYGINKCEGLELRGREIFSTLEKEIGKIWAENLGINTIDITSNFYSLGGHSIIMMKIISDIQKKLHLTVGYNEFSENPTIENIARLLEKSQDRSELKIIECEHNEQSMYEAFPLTELQKAYIIGRDKGMFFGGVSGHIYMEIETGLNLDKLELSLNRVIQRHPMLRTIIYENGTQQILKDIPEYKIEIYTTNSEEKKDFISYMRNKMSHHVMPLGIWPLFEVKALKLDENHSYLFIGIDVLIVDGGSLAVLGNELLEFYRHPQKQLPTIRINVRDYMMCYGRLKQSQQYFVDKKYWREKIKEISPAPSFEYKAAPAEVMIPTFKRITHEFSAGEWEMLQQKSKTIGVSPVAMICEVYAEVLAYWSNQPSFTINFTAFNRYPCHPDVDFMIGDFTSVLLIKIDMQKNDKYVERVKDLQNEITEVLEHRLYDGIEIIRELSKDNLHDVEPVMPFVFTSMLYSGHYPWNDFGKVQYSLSQTPQVYLDCQAVTTDKSMMINWDYVEQLFDEENILIMFEQMISSIKYLLTEMEEN